MKIIISPAKKMNIDVDSYEVKTLPVFIEDTKILMDEIKKLSVMQSKKLWKCNIKLAELNYERFSNMKLDKGLTPAILSYEGLQYQHMAPNVFTNKDLTYIENNLRILSGFYGVLKPFDGVTPYRLEMQGKLSINESKDLYDFWGERLYEEVLDKDRIIINLASKEYSKIIEKYISSEDKFVNIEFGEVIEGKVKQKGTIAKMARGEMVRYMAQNNITNLEDIKNFEGLGFSYSKEHSDDNKYTFII